MASPAICHIITPVGSMGYGFDDKLTAHELCKLVQTGIPTAIILDSGSTDSGPEKLALGSMTCPRSAYLKDMTKLLRLVHTFRVPLLFSSAGGDGADEHVNVMADIVEEICSENKEYCFKTIQLFSSIDKTTVRKRLRGGRVSPCGACVPQLTEADIDGAQRIVAQVGHEPFLDAMEAEPDFDVIIGGRAYDPAPYVAYAAYQLKKQFPNLGNADIKSRLGGFLHMGKIMECGGQCSQPKSHGAIATIYSSGLFDVKPTAPPSICTPLSVAAHTLYENSRADLLSGPGGALDLTGAKYQQLPDGRTVRVTGSRYISSASSGKPYQFKLEAAKVVDYRSMFLGSVRDHILIAQLDKLLGLVKKYVASQHPDVEGEWDLGFHLYGKGHVTPRGPGEVFIIVEAIAPTQQLATSLAAKARVGMIHGPYPGQKATAGNFAFGIGGLMEIELGRCAQFCIYHLMDLHPGEERLGASDGMANGVTRGGLLLEPKVTVIGEGGRIVSDDDFRSSLAFRLGEFPCPDMADIPTYIPKDNSKKAPTGRPKTLSDVAKVLRSKNAGPFEITVDVIFDSPETYYSVKKSKLLNKASLSKALDVSEDDIVWMGYFDSALAFKVSIPRYRGGKRRPAGSFMENDVHGSQQHLGVAMMKLPGQSQTLSMTLQLIWAHHRYKVLGLLLALVGASRIAGFRRLLARIGRR